MNKEEQIQNKKLIYVYESDDYKEAIRKEMFGLLSFKGEEQFDAYVNVLVFILRSHIKQALQEQRQSILEEIEKKIDDMGFIQPEQAGQFGLHASGYNQALEDIKQLLK